MIPERTINVDTLDLFFRRPGDDNIVETRCLKCNCIIKLLCVTVIYTFYESEKHIEMTNVRLRV